MKPKTLITFLSVAVLLFVLAQIVGLNVKWITLPPCGGDSLTVAFWNCADRNVSPWFVKTISLGIAVMTSLVLTEQVGQFNSIVDVIKQWFTADDNDTPIGIFGVGVFTMMWLAEKTEYTGLSNYIVTLAEHISLTAIAGLFFSWVMWTVWKWVMRNNPNLRNMTFVSQVMSPHTNGVFFLVAIAFGSAALIF